MIFLESFRFPSEDDELDVCFRDRRMDMSCYDRCHAYPFHLFPKKQLSKLDFSPITILCGGNGSGKSTVLNLIAETVHLPRFSPFNHTPFFDTFVSLCRADTAKGNPVPSGSRIITSDDVFDFMLNLRAVNDGVDRDRQAVFESWKRLREDREGFRMHHLSDYQTVVEHRDAARSTRSDFTARRIGREIPGQSNGESALGYFTEQIQDHALYLLDEPENSLSAAFQAELAAFIQDSARFYDCQFIIATHSPFLMAVKGAAVYDLDAVPVTVRPWTEIPSVRAFYEFFRAHGRDFEAP